MEKVLEVLNRTDVIYDKKLEEAIKVLDSTDVKDELFDKIINTVSSLISLKIQKVQVAENYEHSQNQKKINESINQDIEGGK